MTTLFPYRERSLDIDGLRYAYVDEGAGPPVLLVHGNPTWSFYFRSLVASLPAEGYRAVAPDHIGMGRSDKPSTTAYSHTLSRRVADFGRFVDSLRLTEPMTLMVHDWGGPIALSWAVEHPDRVSRLVLLNTAAFRQSAGKRLPLALRATRTAVGGVAVLRGNVFARGATHLAVARRMPAEVRRGYVEPYDSAPHRVAVLQFVKDIPTQPSDPAYDVLARTEERLGVFRDRPVLVCWGMRDFVFNADVLARWEEIYPHSVVHRFPWAGHYVLEDAADQIGPLVTDFLRRTEARAALR